MTALSPRDRTANKRYLPSLAKPAREPMCTLALVYVLLMQLIACGGSAPKAKPYEKAIGKQESCCMGLQDPAAREECRNGIVTLDDSAAADSDVNEATFRCVETHFICDAQTGKATAEANQATLDCLTDLGQ